MKLFPWESRLVKMNTKLVRVSIRIFSGIFGIFGIFILLTPVEPLCNIQVKQVNINYFCEKIWNWEKADKVGSYLGGLAALAALGYGYWEYNRQSKQQQASEIRQVLRVIAKDTTELFYRLEKGECLTVAASTIINELKSRLSESTTVENIKDYLKNDTLINSVVIVGWYTSPLSAKCQEFVNQLKQNLIFLNKDLCIVAEAVKLYTKLIEYKYSPNVFITTLLSTRDCLCSDNKKFNDTSELLNELNTKLQEYSIVDCANKYNNLLENLHKFISDLSYTFIDLDDFLLLDISITETVRESKMNCNESKISECQIKDDQPKSEEQLRQVITKRTIDEIRTDAKNLKNNIEDIYKSYEIKYKNKEFRRKLCRLKELAKNIEEYIEGYLKEELDKINFMY